MVGDLVFRFILGVGVCAFPHVLGMKKPKKLPSPRIISGIALKLFALIVSGIQNKLVLPRHVDNVS